MAGPSTQGSVAGPSAQGSVAGTSAQGSVAGPSAQGSVAGTSAQGSVAGPTAGPSAGPSAGQQLRQLLKESLQVLQDQGTVYRKVKSQDELYHVGTHDRQPQTNCMFNLILCIYRSCMNIYTQCFVFLLFSL